MPQIGEMNQIKAVKYMELVVCFELSETRMYIEHLHITAGNLKSRQGSSSAHAVTGFGKCLRIRERPGE